MNFLKQAKSIELSPLSKAKLPYMLLQIARFGALHPQQILSCMEEIGKRSNTYRCLRKLVDGGLVKPILSSLITCRSYVPSKAGIQKALPSLAAPVTGFREHDLDHTLACAEVLIQLSRHQFIQGIQTQFELNQSEAKKFSPSRTPDAIVALNQKGTNVFLAVEVETTHRNSDRVKEVLDAYIQTFKNGTGHCSGALIFCAKNHIYSQYQEALAQLPENAKGMFRIINGLDTSSLPPERYGERNRPPYVILEKVRTSFSSETPFSPIISEELPYPKPSYTQTYRRADHNHKITEPVSEA